MASITAARKPLRSSSATPTMVVPPGGAHPVLQRAGVGAGLQLELSRPRQHLGPPAGKRAPGAGRGAPPRPPAPPGTWRRTPGRSRRWSRRCPSVLTAGAPPCPGRTAAPTRCRIPGGSGCGGPPPAPRPSPTDTGVLGMTGQAGVDLLPQQGGRASQSSTPPPRR